MQKRLRRRQGVKKLQLRSASKQQQRQLRSASKQQRQLHSARKQQQRQLCCDSKQQHRQLRSASKQQHRQLRCASKQELLREKLLLLPWLSLVRRTGQLALKQPPMPGVLRTKRLQVRGSVVTRCYLAK